MTVPTCRGCGTNLTESSEIEGGIYIVHSESDCLLSKLDTVQGNLLLNEQHIGELRSRMLQDEKVHTERLKECQAGNRELQSRLDKAMDARNELSDVINTFGGTGVAEISGTLAGRLEAVDDMLIEALGTKRPAVEKQIPNTQFERCQAFTNYDQCELPKGHGGNHSARLYGGAQVFTW